VSEFITGNQDKIGDKGYIRPLLKSPLKEKAPWSIDTVTELLINKVETDVTHRPLSVQPKPINGMLDRISGF